MRSFELNEPTSVAEALALLDGEDTSIRPVAGGTALLLMMKTRLFHPTRLVSLRGLNDAALRELELGRGGELRIGALTRLAELEGSPLVAKAVPVLARALPRLANVRIRNVATVGGHLAHGDPHMDLPPILLTLGARVRAVSPRGERWIAIDDFFVGYYQTALAKDELITELVIPPQGPGVYAWYEKFTALSADDWPAVGVAVWFRLDDGAIADVRVAIGAATERPERNEGAEAMLAGAIPDAAVFARAAEAAAEAVNPLADIRGSASYKREMVRVHVRRALEKALTAGPTEAE